MSILLDVFVIAIILLCVFVSAKRGFVSVLVETVGIIAAFCLALTFSTPLATLTYNKIIEPSVVERIEAKAQDTAEVTAEQITQAVPESIMNTALALGLPVDEIIEKSDAILIETDVWD